MFRNDEEKRSKNYCQIPAASIEVLQRNRTNRMDGWMDGWISRWMDEWMGEWMDGWMGR